MDVLKCVGRADSPPFYEIQLPSISIHTCIYKFLQGRHIEAVAERLQGLDLQVLCLQRDTMLKGLQTRK